MDDRQINLTRFAIRFPEKEIFLEGANIYRLLLEAVFIHIFKKNWSTIWEPIPILYGGRIIGKIGKVEISAAGKNKKNRLSK